MTKQASTKRKRASRSHGSKQNKPVNKVWKPRIRGGTVATISLVAAILGILAFFRDPILSSWSDTSLRRELQIYRETNVDRLRARFPLGYIPWLVDHHVMVPPIEDISGTGLSLEWTNLGPPELTASRVVIPMPTIKDAIDSNVVIGMRYGVDRRVGVGAKEAPLGFARFDVYVDVLVNEKNHVVTVIGFDHRRGKR